MELCQEKKYRQSRNQLRAYRPYTKQVEFHNAGRLHRERLFMAGNQLGKTLAGGMEVAMHLTGIYPDWWKGRVLQLIPDGNIKIHYEGWGAEWDEVVPRTRLQLPVKETAKKP
ncbi:MAG: hypothetical protein IIA70_09250 [Proteobacteria bacterium]|nr:hypothetical protein [Pseudomonadota bacterium]